MNHSFNVEIAVKYGMLEAVLLEHLSFWIAKNKANGVNFQDGYYWTYNSTKALAELFPYVSKNTISRALHHLEKEGLLISGNYNKSAYDRTTWYALTEKGVLVLQGMDNSICTENTVPETGSSRIGNSISQNDDIHFPKWEMEEPELGNGITQSGTPIPDINTDIETDSNSTVSKWAEKFGICNDILKDAGKRKEELNKELSRLDKELSDILHKIEFESPKDLYKGWLVYKKIKQNRERRRMVKDELLIVSSVPNLKTDSLDRQVIQKRINGLSKRKYQIRVTEEVEDEGT